MSFHITRDGRVVVDVPVRGLTEVVSDGQLEQPLWTAIGVRSSHNRCPEPIREAVNLLLVRRMCAPSYTHRFLPMRLVFVLHFLTYSAWALMHLEHLHP